MEHSPRKRINRREFMIDAGMLVAAGALDATEVERGRGIDEKTEGMRFLHDARRRWVLGMVPGKGLIYFGLDSEETGRENTNYTGYTGRRRAKRRWDLLATNPPRDTPARLIKTMCPDG